MNIALSSLIALAIMAMAHGSVAGVPAPLRQMASALASVHSFRGVMVTSRGAGAPIRADTVFVRHGHVGETYMTQSYRVEDKESSTEVVTTGTRRCIRHDGHGPWDCSPVEASAAPGVPNARLAAMLQTLDTGVRWSELGDRKISGHLCRGYRATATAGSAHEEATLWISVATHRPVELTTTASPSNLATAVTWGDWNDPSLTIPTV